MVSTSSRPSQKRVWVWREVNLMGVTISAKPGEKQYPSEAAEPRPGYVHDLFLISKPALPVSI
jgi:hypothetical protein